MRLILSLFAATAILSASAYASESYKGDCNGFGNCNDSHDVTNEGGKGGNGGNAQTGPITNTNVNTAVGGAGGQGGQGGKGGEAESNATAKIERGAVDIDNHVYSSNSNSNRNHNEANSNSESSSSSRSSAKQSQGQDQAQGQDQSQGQTIVWENPRAPVNTAMAAALTASQETCAGSSSLGAQGVGFGVSIGSTWESDQCNMRRNAALLNAIGAKEASVELLCQDEKIRLAMKSGGTPCAADRPVGQTSQLVLPPSMSSAPTASAAVSYAPMEPIRD